MINGAASVPDTSEKTETSTALLQGTSVLSAPDAHPCPSAQTRAAPTSAHSCLQAGLDRGPPMWSSACPVMALAGWAPPPQPDGHRMAASRLAAIPPPGVPDLSSLPGAAGSWSGSRQLALPPPQCFDVSRGVGENLALTGASWEREDTESRRPRT